MEKILKGIKTRNIQELYNIKNISLDGKIETKTNNITIYKIDPANIVACDDETKHKIYQAYLTCIRGLPDAFQVIISKEKVDFAKQISLYNQRLKKIENEGLKNALKKYIEYLEEISELNNLYKTSHYLITRNLNTTESEEIINVFANLKEFGVCISKVHTQDETEKILRKCILKGELVC